MQLKDFVIQRTRITLPGKRDEETGEKPYFEVRGLSLPDLTMLVQNHIGPLTRALKLYQESKADIMATGNLSGFILTLAKDFPDLVSEVISAAADALDDQTRAVARNMPAAIQISALQEIMRLTVEESGGLKNLLAEMQAKLKETVASVESGDSAPARPMMI